MYEFFFTVSLLKKGVIAFSFHEQEVTNFSPKSVWNEISKKSISSEGLIYVKNVELS